MSRREEGQAAWLRALRATSSLEDEPDRILSERLLDICERAGDAPALIDAYGTVSFRELGQKINQYAAWACQQDLSPGDEVCLLMPNCRDFVPVWLGLTHAGVVVALINSNLQGQALAHCISVVAAKLIIVHHSLASQFETAVPFLKSVPEVWSFGVAENGAPRMDVYDDSAEALLVREKTKARISDRALYIYTSGTTGLPKAAIVSHRRVLSWGLWFGGLLEAGPEDRMYNCLPLYHSVGGIVAISSLLLSGGSVYIREKFSVTAFWEEVVAQNCTLFQYIGELCRYLVNAPSQEWEKKHKLRAICGNGLRGDVWNTFQTRFSIPRVIEFYASTEGNLSLYNVENKVGSIGTLPKFSPQRNMISLIRLDELMKPIRGEGGFCVKAETGEPGEAIAAISGKSSKGAGLFEGYSSSSESERKILRDVFQIGDAWFRTGDLMRRDAEGYFYFIDRLGDTFRWKGENVSTLEVSEILEEYSGVKEAVVYGVAVPGADGRAGMALLSVDEKFDAAGLGEWLKARLPSYARPLFLRLDCTIEMTETFKYKKAPLVAEGFDPNLAKGSLYFLNVYEHRYEELNQEIFDKIISGRMRL